MTFLELANRLLLESAISGNALVTTANQIGEYKQIVTYINAAYQDIQNIHVNWNFLRKDFTFNTTINVNNYLDTSVGISDLGEWSIDTMRVYLTTQGIINEQDLTPVDYDDFRELFAFGNARFQTGMPTHVSVKPDNSLVVYPIPDNTYSINGEYYRVPFVLVNDTDTPIFPPRFHMIIVWRALMYFATQLNAQELFATASFEFRRLLFRLELFAFPDRDVSGALA